MAEFKVIERKCDVARYEKYKKMSEQEFLSTSAKEIVDKEIGDYKAQQIINKWVEEHYAERVDVKDDNNFSIPFKCVSKNGIIDSKLSVSYCRENYTEEWRNVGSEHHWIYARTDIPSIERLDWHPVNFAEILINQDNLEQLYAEYKKVGIIY